MGIQADVLRQQPYGGLKDLAAPPADAAPAYAISLLNLSLSLLSLRGDRSLDQDDAERPAKNSADIVKAMMAPSHPSRPGDDASARSQRQRQQSPVASSPGGRFTVPSSSGPITAKSREDKVRALSGTLSCCNLLAL